MFYKNTKFLEFLKIFIRLNKFTILLVFFLQCTTIPLKPTEPLKVACIGDSITFGAGIKGAPPKTYPEQLQSLLGDHFIVQNFGVIGATALKLSDKPYWKQKSFEDAVLFKPDITIIKLGTNDSKFYNWKPAEYEEDYKALIKVFKEVNPNTFVIIVIPAPSFAVKWSINPEVVKNEIPVILKKIAEEESIPIVDAFTPLEDKEEWFPDQIHPDRNAAKVIAEKVYGKLAEVYIPAGKKD